MGLPLLNEVAAAMAPLEQIVSGSGVVEKLMVFLVPFGITDVIIASF